VTGPLVSSSRGVYVTGSGLLWLLPGPNELQPAADQPLGNSVGAIGWPVIPTGSACKGAVVSGVERLFGAFLLVLTNFCRSFGGGWLGVPVG